MEKGYESGIWEYGFWHDDGKNDYFKLKTHIKINYYLDSSVVNHQIIDTPDKDNSAVSKAFRDIHSKHIKKNDNVNNDNNEINTSSSDSYFR